MFFAHIPKFNLKTPFGSDELVNKHRLVKTSHVQSEGELGTSER